MNTMIEETPYNSRWWGSAYGRVREAAFFDQSQAKIAAALRAFSVVEYIADDLNAGAVAKIRAAGFWRADTQIPFKINLKQFAAETLPERVQRMTVQNAYEVPFSIFADDLPIFTAERFWQLQGITTAHMAQRFALWSADLIAAHPEHCLAVSNQDKLIGWFLARRLGQSSIELTLAMGHPDAPASGGLLYEAAHHYFARQGFRLGQAAFSASNPKVLNMYSVLGAKFLAPRHVWLWQAP